MNFLINGFKFNSIFTQRNGLSSLNKFYCTTFVDTDIGKDPINCIPLDEKVSVSGAELKFPFFNFTDNNWPKEIMGIFKSQGFPKPTLIQSYGWPLALSGRDVVGIAKTGSGKTLAYLLPAFIKISQSMEHKSNLPKCLVLGPTRELVQQITHVVSLLPSVDAVSVFGGASRDKQEIAILNVKPEILVATPGRLIDFLDTKTIDLSGVLYLVLDEADRMLDMGFEPQIREILRRINSNRQTLMFSATWPNEIKKLAEEFLHDYAHITIGSHELYANPNVKQIVDVCNEREKQNKLFNFLQNKVDKNTGKVLIFAETKRRVDSLARILQRKFKVATLHGDKSQNQRDYAMNVFKSNCNILVATDIASRGIDVKEISYVINYDFPRSCEDYIHRIGRTARGFDKGIAYSFFTPDDAPRAKELIEILKQGNHEINEMLYDFAKPTPKLKSRSIFRN